MTRMCIVCGKTFKLDRSAYRHVFLSHYVPDDLVRIYVIKVDQTVNVDSEGDDIEVELIS
jgi:predicted RNA-binding protein YlxR (DUF448 family)